jgi:YHS domain-containing protein
MLLLRQFHQHETLSNEFTAFLSNFSKEFRAMRRIVKSVAVVSSLALLVAMSLPVWAQSGTRLPAGDEGSSRKTPEPLAGSTERTQPAPLALDGYCPVSLKTMNKWVKGDPTIQSVFDGHTYHFANEQGKKMFVADPAKYVPVLGGDCVISLVKMHKRVPGNIRHATIHDGRLFLFANEQAKKMFTADPKTYADADLAYGGKCVVCRVGMKQDVPGKAEFTIVHKGLRYLFASAEQRDEFRASPKKYEVSATSLQPPAGGSGSKEPADSGSGSRN